MGFLHSRIKVIVWKEFVYMSTDQSRAPPQLESIVAVATANAIYHCKSSDYSTEWLLMIHSSDSNPAARATGIYWKRIALIFMSVKQTARTYTANPLYLSCKVYSS